MEEHRLTPMKEGYDKKLFNSLYKDTSKLRKKLAYEIDARRFGVDFNEVLSWFDIKFIFAFNKYCDKAGPNELKARIINALQFFKCRILRSSYTGKAQLFNSYDISNFWGETGNDEDNQKNSPEWLISNEDEKDIRDYLEVILLYMKNNLSPNAFTVLEVTLNPPPFITHKLCEDYGKKKITHSTKIPNELIAEYLDLDLENVLDCRTEISHFTKVAKRDLIF